MSRFRPTPTKLVLTVVDSKEYRVNNRSTHIGGIYPEGAKMQGSVQSVTAAIECRSRSINPGDRAHALEHLFRVATQSTDEDVRDRATTYLREFEGISAVFVDLVSADGPTPESH